MSVRDILTSDSKVVTLGDKKIRISTHETTKPEAVLSLLSEIVQDLKEIKTEENLNGAFFFVVDIINNSSQLIAPSDFECAIASRGFNVSCEVDTPCQLEGVVSRKKQMLPAIEKGI